MGIWRHEGKCALRGRERGIRSTEVVCVSLCKVFMRGEAMMEYLEREREKVLGSIRRRLIELKLELSSLIAVAEHLVPPRRNAYLFASNEGARLCVEK